LAKAAIEEQQLPKELIEVNEKSLEHSLLRLFGPAVLTLMIASGLGFVYWIVAARFYSPAQVGESGATISLIMGIGVASSGGLYAVLLRTLSNHENPRRFHFVTCVSVAVTGGFAGLIAGLLHVSTSTVRLQWLWLMVMSAIWSLFTLQDSILISLRRTKALFVSNVGFGVVKLVLLIAFAGGSLGILGSWALPLIVVVPVVALIADRSVINLAKAKSEAFQVTKGHVAAEYATSFAIVAVFGGVPVIVSSIAGGTFAGVAYVCWMIYVAAESIGTILSSAIVSSSTERGLDAARAVRSARSAVPLILGLLALSILLAPVILSIFGSRYEGGTSLLRLLLLSVMVRVFANISLAARRVQAQFWRVAFSQAISGVVVIAGVVISASHKSFLGIGVSLLLGSIVLFGVSLSEVVGQGLRKEERN
jgi:O-antigen/teichoic acid export membrane protein